MRQRYVVTADYACAYPEPLSASKGDRLAVHQRDSEWPGWIWCTRADGAGGWVPQAWVQVHADRSCTLLRDYTARELTVESGELLDALLTESGWAWVANSTGQSGWVPLANLVPE